MIVEITSLIPRVILSRPAMAAQDRADDHRHEHDEQHVDAPAARSAAAGSGGEEGAQQVLALDADVEQVHLEPDRGGDAGDVERTSPG